MNALSPSEIRDYAELRELPVDELRALIRAGRYRGHTAGLAAGRLQANLVILPERYALDFARFCQRNPKPCPLVGVTATGDPRMTTLGAIDLRSDLPSYNVYRDGELTQQRDDIGALWRDDLVGFALGCSFTFEAALLAAGVALDHVEHNRTVAMYRSALATVAAGPFGGGTVVSMRPIERARLDQVVEISRRFPLGHGAPVHVGAPRAIGIDDLERPDWGDAPRLDDDRVPVFWACGVTPQNAIVNAKLPFCITHTPGRMLIADVSDSAEVPVLAPRA